MATRTFPHALHDSDYERDVCSLCGCWWMDEAKNEWCSEPDGGCRCHREGFILAYLEEMDRVDVAAKGTA